MSILEKKKKKKRDVITSHKKTAMLTLLCKLSIIYNQNLGAYQKQVGFLLRTSRATKKTINNLSRLHDTVAYSTLTKIMKKFSERNAKIAIFYFVLWRKQLKLNFWTVRQQNAVRKISPLKFYYVWFSAQRVSLIRKLFMIELSFVFKILLYQCIIFWSSVIYEMKCYLLL